MSAIAHTWFMAERHLRALMRQPWWIVISLVQPVTYLLLYGQVFSRVVELPGFNATNYTTFVTPGIVIMMALFGGGWNGMVIIMEIDQGVMDRFLVSPVSRVAIIAGRLMQMAFIVAFQSLILLGLGFLTGARYAGGVPERAEGQPSPVGRVQDEIGIDGVEGVGGRDRSTIPRSVQP